ncbi:DUF2330 domain-containing protein [Patulibacter americanus]|uniref:DUF2330 domain-containing protein n=1 Tax=Patulibacter americanus TaxID=588672 RepID=UPI0003B53582|nr:DUF2330 domain-containing protein [Patulibacter americanus]
MPRPLARLIPAPVVLVLALASGLSAARPAGACACGVALDARVTAERALLSLEGGRERMVLSLDLAPKASDARPAVVLPVPATPTVDVVRPDQADVFRRLERATAPLPSPDDAEEDGDGDRAPGAPAGEVRVLSRETVGGYDVTRLRAGDAGELRAWLTRNGYATPRAAAPILRDYVRRRWAFVAVRLARAGSTDVRALRPLAVSFPARRLVYPLRLSSVATRPVSVDLYVAGQHRVTAKGFDTYHAGWVAALRPPLPAPVRELVGGGYLTRLGMVGEDPASITRDVTFAQGVSDRLFRSSEDYPYEAEENFATAPLPSDLPSAAADAPLDGAPGGAAWLLLFPGVAVAVLAVLGLVRLRRPARRA